jgi:magnesium transporter
MISSWAYLSDGSFVQKPASSDYSKILSDKKNLLWIDLEDPTEDEASLILRETFGFHPLLIDDCISSHSQPKIDQLEDYFFLVIHSCFFYEEKALEEALSVRELDIFAGPNYIVTYHKGHIRSVSTNRKRCEKGSHIMSKGADFLLYNLLDALVDNYFPIIEGITEHLDEIEEKILSDPTPIIQASIFKLKRSLVTLRKIIGPQRELITNFLRPEFTFIQGRHKPYFKDIYDHIVRIYDISESARELISADMEAYLSAISFKLNETMKTLTIIATLVLPLTLITGFYGMNIQIPEFRWGIWGYLFVWGLIVGAVASMLSYFRKKRLL